MSCRQLQCRHEQCSAGRGAVLSTGAMCCRQEHVSVNRSCLIDRSMVFSTGACFGGQELVYRQEHSWRLFQQPGRPGRPVCVAWKPSGREVRTEQAMSTGAVLSKRAWLCRQTLFYRQEHGSLDRGKIATGAILSTGACFGRQELSYRLEHGLLDRGMLRSTGAVSSTGAFLEPFQQTGRPGRHVLAAR